MNLLIVEDTEMLREMIVKFLSIYNAVIYQASSGNEAKKILEQTKIDIVISDYSMPNGHGGDLFKYMKEKHPNIEFILNTSRFIEELPEFKDCANQLKTLDKYNLARSLEQFAKERLARDKE